MAWRGFLAAFVVLGAAGIVASPASADIGVAAVTHIYWTGTPCIQVASAQKYNPTQFTVDTICGGSWRFSEGNIWPGDLFGGDPIMGAANYIECAVFRGGQQVWYDSAVAGDGNDVTCLRRAI